MIRDALSGRIDLIVTKSVSRFARNTVDSLTTIRKLKDAGCEVYFEKEAIWTFDSKGELLITIMSSLAQEESRSISENVTWGQRKRFADGKVSMPYKHFLGYRKGPDGLPEIDPEQAETVRHIYDLFMSGMTTFAVAKRLTAEGIPTPAGKQNWSSSTVESILHNEKYRGSALLQKRFTVDFLQKKLKVNEGEVPQYYVEKSHPAIVTPELFDQVQEEMARRKKLGRRYRTGSLFSCRLVCGDCGEFFGPKVWNSTDKYRRVIWQCNAKFKGEHRCSTPHLTEEAIKEKFIAAFNQLLPDRERLIEDCRVMQAALCGCTEVDREIVEALQETEILAEMIEMLPQLAGDASKTHRDELLVVVRDHADHLHVLLNAKCTGVEPGKVSFEVDGKAQSVDCDNVLLAVGLRARRDEADAFMNSADDFFEIGDCVRARTVEWCTKEGFYAALNISR